MTSILLSGCSGRMGQAIAALAEQRDDIQIVCGVDVFTDRCCAFPVYTAFSGVKETPQVIVDFSNPAALDGLLEYSLENKVPCVLCTTGYSDEQLTAIDNAAKNVAVFRSGNMSLGVNLLIELAKTAAKVLGSDFDVEIVEKHHNRKIDAPSGTALMIADGIASARNSSPEYVYDRHSVRRKRDANEIGIHSVRGGGIVGEHDVIFAGENEVLTISHQAQSRALFAEGAVNAAVYLADKESGLYNMSDLLKSRY